MCFYQEQPAQYGQQAPPTNRDAVRASFWERCEQEHEAQVRGQRRREQPADDGGSHVQA